MYTCLLISLLLAMAEFRTPLTAGWTALAALAGCMVDGLLPAGFAADAADDTTIVLSGFLTPPKELR